MWSWMTWDQGRIIEDARDISCLSVPQSVIPSSHQWLNAFAVSTLLVKHLSTGWQDGIGTFYVANFCCLATFVLQLATISYDLSHLGYWWTTLYYVSLSLSLSLSLFVVVVSSFFQFQVGCFELREDWKRQEHFSLPVATNSRLPENNHSVDEISVWFS